MQREPEDLDRRISELEAELAVLRQRRAAINLDPTNRLQLDVASQRDLFRLALDAIPDYVYVKDRHLRFVLVNRAIAQNAGVMSTDDMLGRTDFDFTSHASASRYAQVERQVLATGKPVVEVEEADATPDGEHVSILSTKIPLVDGQGRVCGLVGIGRNVTNERRALAALHDSEQRYRLLAESIEDVVSLHDTDGVVVFVTPSVTQQFGWPVAEIVGDASFQWIHPDDFPQVIGMLRGQQPGGVSRVEWRCRLYQTNEYRWVESVSRLTADGNRPLYLSCTRDITARRLAEDNLRRRESLLQAVFEMSPVGMVLFRPDGRILSANAAMCDLTGYCPDDITTRSMADLSLPAEWQRECQSLLPELLGGQARKVRTERTVLNRQGHRVDVEMTCRLLRLESVGKMANHPSVETLVIGVVEDITERKRSQAELMRLAFRDSLTQLANRAMFFQMLEHAIERQRRDPSRRFAVLFIDLDRFKPVNDRLGHAAGDNVLRVVAHRISLCSQPGDTVARLGGDEFAVLLEDLTGLEEAVEFAHRVIAQVSKPVTTLGVLSPAVAPDLKKSDIPSGLDLQVGASVGIVTSEHARHRAAAYLRLADRAMYRAKSRGGQQAVVFSRDLFPDADSSSEELAVAGPSA